jgi:threonine dehydrogenase-like Zn-dependent dehydrogenase
VDLCETYHEIGFTRDGAAADQVLGPAGQAHPGARHGRRDHRAALRDARAPRRGGTVLLIGLPPHGDTVPLEAEDIVNNDLTTLGSFSYTPAAWRC